MIPVKQHRKKPWLKWLLISGFGLLIIGGGIFWYAQTKKYADTKDVKADYTITATELIRAFEQDNQAANEKYTDKILNVSGMVSEIEAADTTMNIKFIDTATGSYAIFAFQQQHVDEAKTVKTGNTVSIKGACSGGIFSRLRKATSITFQRCTLVK